MTSKILIEALEGRVDKLEQALAEIGACAEFYNDPYRRLDFIEVRAKDALIEEAHNPSRCYAWQSTSMDKQPF